MGFSEKVYERLCQVPRGHVTTYAELARAAGNQKAVRAVGQIMHANPDAPRVPCHRVVRSDGALGGYAGGQQEKRDLLESEGILMERGRVMDFEKKLFRLPR